MIHWRLIYTGFWWVVTEDWPDPIDKPYKLCYGGMSLLCGIMSFIIKHEFNISDIPYYVRLVDNKKFEEIYDPSYATRFKTELEARNWIDTYSSMADHSKIVDTANAISEYQKWAESGTVRRVLSCINTSISYQDLIIMSL